MFSKLLYIQSLIFINPAARLAASLIIWEY